jgi:hypothetical protein
MKVPSRVDAASSNSLDFGFVLATAQRLALPTWFLVFGLDRALTFVTTGRFGIDAQIYREAAVVALNGGNAWQVLPSGSYFAAPPPTLLFYLPAAFVPVPIAIVGAVGICLASSWFIIRRLRLPAWWLLFPPLVEAIVVGNPDPSVLAILLFTGPVAGLSATLKAYAAVPLVMQRRWRAVALAAAVAVVSAPLWVLFFDARDAVAHGLTTQAVGLSAWGTWLVIPGGMALVMLRDRGAEWLAVPVLWPATQSHYAVIAMPALRRSAVGAAVMSLAIPLAPVAAGVLMAAEHVVQDRGAFGLQRRPIIAVLSRRVGKSRTRQGAPHD